MAAGRSMGRELGSRVLGGEVGYTFRGNLNQSSPGIQALESGFDVDHSCSFSPKHLLVFSMTYVSTFFLMFRNTRTYQ